MLSLGFRRVVFLLAVAVLLPATLAAPAKAIHTTRVASGLNRPIFVTSPPGDPRLFIVEQRGVIKILENGAVLPTPFLDIDALIPDPGGNDERGLLGLAFDPAYAASGRFYVYYYNLANQTVTVRYQVSGNPDVADAGSATTILAVAQPAVNHNGGTLAFGPGDGYLYVGLGDGGGAGDPNNRAQNPLELLGKMLRLDVSGPAGYTIPPTNPFAGNPAYRGEIWAVGVRNPYRYSFDRQTHDLWIADVGQNLWEEIDFQPAASPGGENYGWRLLEGNHCYNPPTGCETLTGLTAPIHEYSHAAGNCSITGGYVYRGTAIPGLSGTYFFADFCSATIWSLRYDGQVVSEFTDRTAELAPGGGLSIAGIAGFGEDSSGELYIADRGTTTSNGEMYKIVGDVSDSGGSPGSSGRAGFLRFTTFAPNPLRDTAAFSLETMRPGHLVVEVLDAGGRLVRRLASGDRPAGGQALTWDGADGSGRPVAAGAYFVRASLDGQAVTRTVSVVR